MSTISLKRDITEEIIASFGDVNIERSEQRLKAIRTFKELGLPTHKSEEYRFTPITKQLEKNFSWGKDVAQSSIISVEEFLIPDLDANVLVFVNGSYSKDFSKIISPKTQVIITTLSEALLSNERSIESYFGKIGQSENDAFAAMNAAFWQEGVYLQIPNNTFVEKPIVVLHVNDARYSQVVAHTRLLLVVGEHSEVNLVEKFDSIGDNSVFHTFTEEIVVKAQACVEYCKIQNDKGNSTQLNNTTIQQSTASKVKAYTLSLDGQLIRNNFSINVDGEHCESHFNGLYLLKDNTLVDNHTVVDHKQPNCYSNELYKGVMDGNSKGVFNGKIYVRPQAQKTNAFQSNRNILMSDFATINTKPQLEIWADDVKCSHGCTTGQLDEEALFYLQSRGISKLSGQAMLLYAFAAEVIEPVSNKVIKDYCNQLISERLQKNF